MVKIGFGGGCHWCTEAVFQSLRGVQSVEQGFIQSTPPTDIWSEAVVVTFDEKIITTATLINVHLRTHASTKAHSMRSKYRSAVYTFSEDQADLVARCIAQAQPDFDAAILTKPLPFVAFKASDVQFQNYYETNPDRPFCKRYIDPKLDTIRREFAADAAI
jgi:peptide-methionine (S)-S-oxide reductase